jgi:hypothetical protein
MKLKDEFARLRHIKSQLSRIKGGGVAEGSSSLQQQVLADEKGVMGLTKQDVEVTKVGPGWLNVAVVLCVGVGGLERCRSLVKVERYKEKRWGGGCAVRERE